MASTQKNNGGGGLAISEGSVKNGANGRFVATAGLTDKQKGFVRHYVANGGNSSQAALAAGYTARDAGWDILKLPHVRLAIQIEREKVLETDLPSLGVKVIKEMMMDTSTAAAVRAKLAMWAVDKAHPNKEKQDSDEKPLEDMTVSELQEHIRKGKLALDGFKIAKAKVIDA